MILTLAQLDKVDPGLVRDILIVLACFVGLAIGIFTLIDKVKAKKATGVIVSPDPLQVRGVKDLATREELEAIKEDIDKDISGLRVSLAESERKSHGEIVAIHTRINQVAENTSAMKGRLDEIAQSLHELVRRSMK